MDFRNLKSKDQFKFHEIVGVYVKLNDSQAMSENGKIVRVNPNEEIIPQHTQKHKPARRK